MKILALTSSYPRFPGDSTAPFIESITTHVAKLGHEVHLVVPEHRDWRWPSVADGVHYHPYRYSLSRNWTPWGYAGSLRSSRIRTSLYAFAPVVYLSAVHTCNALASLHQFDVVHAHWVVPNGPIAARIARRWTLPLVISLHGSDVALTERSRLIGGIARGSLLSADRVTTASRYVLDRARLIGVREDALALVPYGIDARAFRPDPALASKTRERLGIGRGVFVVLGIGRLIEWKGFRYLIDAAAAVRAGGADVRVVIVGDGDLRSDLRAQVRAQSLDEIVSFVGSVPHSEVAAYFAAADIVAVPSIHHEAGFFEALGNVSLEALAAGKPVVATRVGGLVDVVRDGENGFLVEEKSVGALAEAITKLATDPELSARLGANGRNDILSRQTWADSARQLESVYQQARDHALLRA